MVFGIALTNLLSNFPQSSSATEGAYLLTYGDILLQVYANEHIVYAHKLKHSRECVHLTTFECHFLGTNEFSSLAGITRQKGHRALSRAYSGLPWRGHHLIVRVVHGKGGKSGLRYEVWLPSLPLELQHRYSPPAQSQLPLALPEPPPPASDTQTTDWRYTVIQPALKHPSRSPERAGAVREIAGRRQPRPDGSWATVPERTVREWIRRYEAEGLRGLTRRKWMDAANRRVLISRAWDKAVILPLEDKQRIATAIEEKIRSLWAGLKPDQGWYEVRRHASTELRRLTHAAAPDIPAKKLARICEVPRALIERFRAYRAVAVHDQDAKQYFDHYLPRVTRSTDKLQPMQIVMGDVHPIDIYYRRDDGAEATPKGIFWMDMATERLWCLPEFFPKGRGVRKENVVRSFVDMSAIPRGGAREASISTTGANTTPSRSSPTP